MIAFVIRLIPKFFHGISLVIAVCILTFLLLGCTTLPRTYSSVYLATVHFNQTILPHADTNSTTNSTAACFKMGYLGLCLVLGNSTQCAPYLALTNITNAAYTTVLTSGNQSLLLDMAKVATGVNNACHPHLLMASIVITLVLLTLGAWCMLPFVPGKYWARNCGCCIAAINVLLWGLGSMLQHTAIETATNTIASASMGLLSMEMGKRADAMTWTAFLFLIVLLLCSGVEWLRESRIASLESKAG